MPTYTNDMLEEELKHRVAGDYFAGFDSTRIIGKIDFCIAIPAKGGEGDPESLMWAEAKKGTSHDIYESFVQLIITIGRARTFDTYLPPKFLGAFDAAKIAFLPYNSILDVFYQNDFNWNVTPSDHSTKEFQLLLGKVKGIIERGLLLYKFGEHDKELRAFVRKNFTFGREGLAGIRINKNNFTHVYQKWLAEVKPTIAIDWELAKTEGLIAADFYLADLLSEHNVSLREKLFVLLRNDRYVYNIRRRQTGSISFDTVDFNDAQTAHTQFWNRYVRPPKREYWDYIAERRDLLVPQDVRERKGSYFTPKRWVELSQQYIAAELGDDWQDDYYVWDCCAGTGNLLNGLSNKYNIWASTLDQADVDVMKERIANGANLLDSHVFQFDFLNDDFSRLPQGLQDIIADPERRRKLVIYINPPYAEVSSVGNKGKLGVNKSMVHDKYCEKLGTAGRELFTQFFIRIYHEIPSCTLAEFSTLKILQGAAFADFREHFRARLGRFFVVPAATFDNVKGQFPIGFFIWHTDQHEVFNEGIADVYDEKGNALPRKIFALPTHGYINKWISLYKATETNAIGFLAGTNGNDFQQNNIVYILQSKFQMKNPRGIWIDKNNLTYSAIYYSVRHCMEATWLNDRDQFLYPNDGWEKDKEFQTDCLAFMLFNNNIQSEYGINHWIPFTEVEVGAQEAFASHFMSDYIRGRHRPQASSSAPDLFTEAAPAPAAPEPLAFSAEATAVFDAGRELWRYYHAQAKGQAYNPNASFYDIRLHFQGTKTLPSGKTQMNPKSTDERYTALITALRQSLKTLARKIEPKVYEHGFLLR